MPAAQRLLLQPGFLVVAGVLAACGWQLHQFQVAWTDTSQPRWIFALVFTTALLALVVLHELGHVLAAWLHGHRVTRVRIGTRFGVTTVGEHTGRSVRVTAAAGPLVGTAAALLVLVVAPPWSAVWAAGLVALVENVANVVLFVVPGTDGAKMVSGSRCLAAERSRAATHRA